MTGGGGSHVGQVLVISRQSWRNLGSTPAATQPGWAKAGLLCAPTQSASLQATTRHACRIVVDRRRQDHLKNLSEVPSEDCRVEPGGEQRTPHAYV